MTRIKNSQRISRINLNRKIENKQTIIHFDRRKSFLFSFSKPLTVNNKVILGGNMSPDWKMKNYCSPMLFDYTLKMLAENFFAPKYITVYNL